MKSKRASEMTKIERKKICVDKWKKKDSISSSGN